MNPGVMEPAAPEAAVDDEAQELRTSRINVILPTDLLDDLRRRARADGTTLTEMLRYAIGLSTFCDDIFRSGGSITAKRRDGSVVEILPRFGSVSARRSQAVAHY